jgi:hypothetical protein
MARSTIGVEFIRTWANSCLEGDWNDTKGVRLGISLALEEVLFQTGNYKGFAYLDTRDPSHPEFDGTRRYYF